MNTEFKKFNSLDYPYFIADIAANHDGSLDRAKELIWLAKEAGADCAKFQHFVADKIVNDTEFQKIESLEILEYVLSEDFVEEKARTGLQLKKPGEQVVRILNPKEDTNIEGDSLEKTFPLNNPVHWWYYFTHK